jgi:hypothetical protein
MLHAHQLLAGATAQLAALSPIHTIAPHLSQHACEQLMGVEHERPTDSRPWLCRIMAILFPSERWMRARSSRSKATPS